MVLWSQRRRWGFHIHRLFRQVDHFRPFFIRIAFNKVVFLRSFLLLRSRSHYDNYLSLLLFFYLPCWLLDYSRRVNLLWLHIDIVDIEDWRRSVDCVIRLDELALGLLQVSRVINRWKLHCNWGACWLLLQWLLIIIGSSNFKRCSSILLLCHMLHQNGLIRSSLILCVVYDNLLDLPVILPILDVF